MRESSSERPRAEPPEAMTARVRASFERQAMMATLGARLSAVERGRVELVVDHDDRFTQQHGFLHAGSGSRPALGPAVHRLYLPPLRCRGLGGPWAVREEI